MKTEIAKPQKFRNIADVLKDDNQRAKLTNLIDEAVKCKSKISFEQDNIKALRDTALDDLGIKPKLFNAYVATVYNNDYTERREGLEEQLQLIEKVMAIAGIAYDSED